MSAALLSADSVGVSYGRRRVLRAVSLELHAGECVGLVGENGAGKSTLIKVLVGLLPPNSGSVKRACRIGYCPQEPLVFDGLTVDENLTFFAAAYGLAHNKWRATADELADALNFGRDRRTPVGALSGGTRQKLNLALALLADPDALILDEPYAGFDWETYQRFWRLAADRRARGRSVLIVSHLVYDRTSFDRLFEIRGGSLHPTESVS